MGQYKTVTFFAKGAKKSPSSHCPCLRRYGAMVKFIISIFLFLLSFTSLANDFYIEKKCTNGLMVNAKIENVIATFSFWDNYSFSNDRPLLWGEVEVINTTSIDKKFSTKQLMLTIEGDSPFRGYSNTIGSSSIDFGFITIKPQQLEGVNIYWPSARKIGQQINKLELNCIGSP